MGAGGTEGGHALIETDFSGAKRWGTPDGVNSLFTDGTTLFLQQGESIVRFDPATHDKQGIISSHPTLQRKGQLVGMAARQGTVYLAYYAPLPYMDNATDTSTVDLENCLPKLRPSIPRSDNYGIPVTPQRDFMSLFRLGGHINGDPRSLLALESTSGRGRQQHILLSFMQPVPLGSLVFPRPESASNLTFRLSVLKPDAPYPPRVAHEADWVPVSAGPLQPWNCVPVPEGTATRAVRITFAQPGDDVTAALEGAVDDEAPSIGLDLDAGKGHALTAEAGDSSWCGRIEGMRLLRMRFRSLLADAKVRVSSGVVNPTTGEWDAGRTEVLSDRKPAIYALEWDKPQKVRGLAIKEIDGERTAVDVYTGPAGGAIDIASDTGWTNVATYVQQRRNFYQPDAGNNAEARYIDGTVDFGADWETRAVRLRIVKQWAEKGGYPEGVRRDRGGTTVDPKRCRVYGVAPLQYCSRIKVCEYQRKAREIFGNHGQALRCRTLE